MRGVKKSSAPSTVPTQNLPAGSNLRPLDAHSVNASRITGPGFRLDASFYRADFVQAELRLTGSVHETRKLRTLASAFVPARTRLITVRSSVAGAPYLRAHDAFEIRPSSDRYVARGRLKNYDELLLKEGMILTPSSGRNLGPVAYVGQYLTRFAMTDIMRIVPNERDEGFYLLAYLLTPTAQSLIRKGRSGTTVDHLAPEDVLNLDIPWISDVTVRSAIADDMRRAETMLDEGRAGLDAASSKLHAEIGIEEEPPTGQYLSQTSGDAFSTSSTAIGLRFDAASHDPSVQLCATTLRQAAGVDLGEVAALKTLQRYVRYYVEPPNGRPVLSGRQMLQLRPVNLRRISDRSFKKPDEFVVKAGSTIFTCDGRSEEALGEPAYVMPVWDGWLASEHVMRVEPKPEIGSGYLYLALTSPWVQRQLKSRATGSVIDALEPEEIEKVVLPMVPKTTHDALNEDVERCWKMISDSIALTQRVSATFEEILGTRKSAAAVQAA